MKETRLAWGLIFLFSLFSPASPAVKQVRVIIDRAGIYIEPSRTSSRIDVVEKGTVLNLFQQKKVNDAWYYINFSSRRYGSRISGFIHESHVEPIDDEAAVSPPKAEEKRPGEKIQGAPAPERIAPQTPQETPRPTPPKAEPKPEIQLKPEPIAKYEEALTLTALPKPKSFRFPRREPARREPAWKPPETVQPKEELPPIQPEVKKELPVEKKAEKPEQKAVKTEPKREAEKPPQVQKKEPAIVRPAPVRTARQARPGRTPGFITLGLGYGSSFGGAGASLQLNIGLGFSLHAGAGLYPTTLIYSETEWVKNKALFNAGLKYYLPFESTLFYPYIDLQYGGLRVEAAQAVIGIWEYSYIYSQEQKALYGPSLLAGTEVRSGRFGISGALGLSYCLTKWDLLEKKVFLAFDVSLIVDF